MKKLVISLIVIAIPVALLFVPQKNEIELKAQTKAAIGELVILDASASSTAFSWYFASDDADFEIIENGKKAVFSAQKTGTYTFILTAANGESVVHTISVTLAPVIDDFIRKIRKWIPKNARPKVIEKVARSFERVASAGHTSIESLVKTTALSNRAILGNDITEWKPFLQAFSNYLKTNLKDANIDKHIEAWFKLAAALRSSE